MLHASFHIASGMGARPDPQAKKQISVVANGEKTSSTAPPNVVGNARLGLWLGTRLLGAFFFASLLSRVGRLMGLSRELQGWCGGDVSGAGCEGGQAACGQGQGAGEQGEDAGGRQRGAQEGAGDGGWRSVAPVVV